MSNLAPLSNLLSFNTPSIIASTNDSGASQFDEILNQQLVSPSDSPQTSSTPLASKTTSSKPVDTTSEPKVQVLPSDSVQHLEETAKQPTQLQNQTVQNRSVDKTGAVDTESLSKADSPSFNKAKLAISQNAEPSLSVNDKLLTTDAGKAPATDTTIDLFDLIADIHSISNDKALITDESVIQTTPSNSDTALMALMNAGMTINNPPAVMNTSETDASAHEIKHSTASDKATLAVEQTLSRSIPLSNIENSFKSDDTAVNLATSTPLLSQSTAAPVILANANLLQAPKELVSKAESVQSNSKEPEANPVMSNQANKPAIDTLIPPVTEASTALNIDRNASERIINSTERQVDNLNSLDTNQTATSFILANAESGSIANTSKPSLPQYPINSHFQQPGWSQEIGNRLVWMANQDIQSAQLTVNPENLGTIQIQIQVDANKVANILFFSPQAEVRQALENSMSNLSQLLNESGISLGQTNVGSETARQQFQQQAKMTYLGPEELIEPPTLLNTTIQGSGLINTTA